MKLNNSLKIGNTKLESEEKKGHFTTLIDQLEKNIIAFYDVRSTAFMKDKRVSDHETYYLHCLRFMFQNWPDIHGKHTSVV